jgi:hypothetical protein
MSCCRDGETSFNRATQPIDSLGGGDFSPHVRATKTRASAPEESFPDSIAHRPIRPTLMCHPVARVHPVYPELRGEPRRVRIMDPRLSQAQSRFTATCTYSLNGTCSVADCRGRLRCLQVVCPPKGLHLCSLTLLRLSSAPFASRMPLRERTRSRPSPENLSRAVSACPPLAEDLLFALRSGGLQPGAPRQGTVSTVPQKPQQRSAFSLPAERGCALLHPLGTPSPIPMPQHYISEAKTRFCRGCKSPPSADWRES